MPFCPERIAAALAGSLARFAAATSGNTVIVFALALPVLVGGVGVGVDYTLAAATRSKMQGVADAAAVAAAQELILARSDPAKIAAVATTFVNAMLQAVTITTNVDVNASTVQVVLSKTYTSMMGSFVQSNGIALSVRATARMNGSLPLCLLGLDPSSPGTLGLQASAQLTASVCLVQSDSTSPAGIQSQNSATMLAGLICSSGGKVQTSNANFSPQPTTDCPAVPDPLKARMTPSVGACNQTNKVADGTTETLQPGVYCGGLKITNNASVTLASGIFIIKDGPLIVNYGASLNGTNVALFLTGTLSNLTFDVHSTISLTAPTDGPLAGILIFDDPAGAGAPLNLANNETGNCQQSGNSQGNNGCSNIVPSILGSLLPPREHQILSSNARNLLGTIYMPHARLSIGAAQPIADKSAYTVLVVRQLNLYAGPTLVLNSDYSATNVPVPMGLGPYGAKASLTQ
jgi:Flp pilus assembly protein TadG